MAEIRETGETCGETAQLVKNLSRKRKRDLRSVLEDARFTFIFYTRTQLVCWLTPVISARGRLKQ